MIIIEIHANLSVQFLQRQRKQCDWNSHDIRYAVRYKRVQCVCLLLKYGASVYCVDNQNNTVFHWAARKKIPPVMAMLLKNQNPNEEKTSNAALPFQLFNEVSKLIAKLQVSLNEANTSGKDTWSCEEMNCNGKNMNASYTNSFPIQCDSPFRRKYRTTLRGIQRRRWNVQDVDMLGRGRG